MNDRIVHLHGINSNGKLFVIEGSTAASAGETAPANPTTIIPTTISDDEDVHKEVIKYDKYLSKKLIHNINGHQYVLATKEIQKDLVIKSIIYILLLYYLEHKLFPSVSHIHTLSIDDVCSIIIIIIY